MKHKKNNMFMQHFFFCIIVSLLYHSHIIHCIVAPKALYKYIHALSDTSSYIQCVKQPFLSSWLIMHVFHFFFAMVFNIQHFKEREIVFVMLLLFSPFTLQLCTCTWLCYNCILVTLLSSLSLFVKITSKNKSLNLMVYFFALHNNYFLSHKIIAGIFQSSRQE